MTISNNNLEKLHQKGSGLASAAESLAALFEQEAIRLRRKDEIVRLTALRSSILRQVERAIGEEMAAKSDYNKTRTEISLFQLAAGLVMMTSENRTMQAISRELLAESNDREPHYGNVLIRIGPKGLPEDVAVVCISSLARESKRDETEIVDRLLAGGNLLFGGDAFSSSIDALVDEIHKGKLSLPVSPERISQIRVSRPIKLNPTKKG